jgi:hypothetical protein
MLPFGKYAGKFISEINDIIYIRYLSQYNYYVSDDKIIVSDAFSDSLDTILMNKEAYESRYESIYGVKNEKLWKLIESASNDIEKIKIIYKHRKYFELMFNFNKELDFSNFYLVLYQNNIIEEARVYLRNNCICLHCGIKMPIIDR